jgi:PadR family transcriptional regulator PadR
MNVLIFAFSKQIIPEDNLKILTRLEEYVLLSILNLRENAYLVTIQKYLEENTNNNLSFGTLHVLLKRLEQSEFLSHYVGEATSKRGGRAIKYYKLTPNGVEALKEIQSVSESMWANFSDLT